MGIVSGGSGGSQPVVLATKTLTSAQIKALHATSITLDGAPAPGTAKGYLILGWQTQAFPGGTPYTVPVDARLEVGPKLAVDGDWFVWETGTGTDAARAVNGDGSGDNCGLIFFTQPAGQVGLVPPALIANQPLAIGNPGAEFTLGDGTLSVTVFAAIIDVTP